MALRAQVALLNTSRVLRHCPPRPDVPGSLPWDYTDANVPWAYAAGTSPWQADLPDGVPVVDLSSTGATFWDRLNNTQAAQSGRHIIRLPAGRHMLTSFRMIGSSGDPNYAFGFWFPKVAGFVGPGPDVCSIEMAANSMTTDQLARIQGQTPKPGTNEYLTQTDFNPSQIGFCRIDSNYSANQPMYCGGLTFRAADQQNVTTLASDLSHIFRPQPAPHRGVVPHSDTAGYGTFSYVRFQAAGRALNSQPPFEHANVETGRSYITYSHCESDGRRAPEIDPARPRRCGVMMGNSEHDHLIEDSWLHHSNVSRYAVNDQNNSIAGLYTARRAKLEQITNTRNTDPALNGGASLSGFTNATPFGWESSNATILIEDVIVCQDNPYTDGQFPAHFQLTSVGNRNPQGGRMTVRRTIARSSGQPLLDGYITYRIKNTTYWWTDGFNTTLTVEHPVTGDRLQPYTWTAAWPPTASTLAAAGISPSTHFIVRAA